MDNYEYSELLKTLQNKVDNIRSIINPDQGLKRLEEISELENSPDFWQDVKRAGILGKEKTKLENLLKQYENAKNSINDAKELFDLANLENDEETLKALFDDSKNLEESIVSLEIAISIIALYQKTHILYTCFLALLKVQSFYLKALPLAKSKIHPIKHRSPVIALSTTCSRMY